MAIDPDTVAQTDHRINRLVADLFFHPAALAHGAEHGVDDPFVLYGGRVLAMGLVTEEVAIATLGFLAPGLVAGAFGAIQAHPDPIGIAEVFSGALAAAARGRWPDGPCATVVEAGRTIASAAPTLGLPLFAAWRARPLPDDPVGAAAITLMALRELRGDIHVQEVAAAGLRPIEAEAVSGGDAGLQLHGWPEPWPDPEPLRPAMAEVEAATNRRMQGCYSHLEPVLAERFVASVADLARATEAG